MRFPEPALGASGTVTGVVLEPLTQSHLRPGTPILQCCEVART